MLPVLYNGQNPFEKYRRFTSKTYLDKKEEKVHCYASSTETITLTIVCSHGEYYFGYTIYSGGEQKIVPPNPDYGVFPSKQFAEGYLTAAIIMKAKISDEAKRVMEQRLLSLLQYNLFE